MSDIRERTAVDNYRCVFQRLHQVRLDRILEDRGHCSCGTKISCCHRLLVHEFSIGVTYDNFGKSLFEILQIFCQTESRHNLGCNGNIKAILAGCSVQLCSKSVDDIAELTVVHVDAAFPDNLSRVYIQRIALLNGVIYHSCKEVVCRADGVHITGKVKVDILHGNDLRIAAACCTALYTEHGAHRRLAKSSHRVFAQSGKRIDQTDGRGGFSLTGRCRIDGGYKNQFSVGSVHVIHEFVRNFCLVLSVALQVLFGNSGFLRNLGNRLHDTFLCNLNV